jgi:ribosomal-protein-alanine N-acetyltransferase
MVDGSLSITGQKLRCLVENIGSERVMQKVGMTLEGTLREQMYVKGKYRDLKLYALLKKNYSK